MKKILMKNKIFIFSVIILSVLSGCTKTNFKKNENIKPYLTIKDSYEREIVLRKKPERIISLSPAVTEIFYYMNSIGSLVGRTDYCDYPEDVKNIMSVGAIITPNMEAILYLKPDLIIASDHFQKNTLSEIQKMNIPVYIGFLKNDYDAVYKLINDIGIMLDNKPESEKLISGMKKEMGNVEKKIKKIKSKPKVYYMISYGDAGNFTAGRDTYISKLIKLAGGENIGDIITGWEISYENLLNNDPDIIICSKYNNIKKNIIDNNFFKKLNAVKNNRVYEMDINLIDRIGPRNIEGLKTMAKIIHPEVFSD